MDQKLCRNCDTVKPLSYFSKSKGKSDGLQPFCKECMKVYLKSRYEATREYSISTRMKRKADLRRHFAEYKSTLKCEECPESHPAALDFHHRDGSSKEATVSQAVALGWSLKRLMAEIAKCRVLCSNCHRKLHWLERLEEHTGYDPVPLA